jgi:hypothetical protein
LRLSPAIHLWLGERPDEFIDHRPAGFDTVPGQQPGDGPARSAFVAQFDDDLPPGLEILETRSAAWLKFGGSLPDGIRVSDGHKDGNETGECPETAALMPTDGRWQCGGNVRDIWRADARQRAVNLPAIDRRLTVNFAG